ncbi:hypothetical protein BLNAU_403 [Blattamonas nauphoetae]|uniref:Uncharacterized protein n=1 Tax=Blattamonas nauphoetae TaxID=2049346 RepID=A0ABQ9YL45_9EUKA|nr:hypothetical protein BLNAU_403 [Blattamonas nauphoetae]
MSTPRQNYLQSSFSSTYSKQQTPTQPRSVSPVKTKIDLLTTRLDTFQQNLSEDRTIKFQTFENELSVIQEDIRNLQKVGDEQLFSVQEEIERMRIMLEHSTTEREVLQQKLDEDTFVADDLLHQAISREQMEGNRTLEEAQQMAQDRLIETQTSVTDLLTERTEKMKADFSSLLDQIPVLQLKMNEEREAEELFVKQLEEKLKTEVAQLKQAIEQERTLRNKLEKDATTSLNEFRAYAQAELQNERSDRQQTEQALFLLWEQTSKKIEDARVF